MLICVVLCYDVLLLVLCVLSFCVVRVAFWVLFVLRFAVAFAVSLRCACVVLCSRLRL